MIATSSESVLHVGCGSEPLPEWVGGVETRLDVDETCSPDIVANMINLGDVGEFDVVYCSHALEHLYPHEVEKALLEFYRVLKVYGRLVVFVPDLEDARATGEVLYVSPAGPISGLDLFFGMASQIEASPHMAHHTGFTSSTLKLAIQDAGFKQGCTCRLPNYSLMGLGMK